MFAQEFVRNAWLAGTAIALASGLIGYFVVLRAQVFAGDALSHVAFTGALAAAAAGIDIRIGLFAATILIALLLGALGDRSHADDVTIGVTFAWILGLGVFFLALFSTGSGGGNGLLGARTLFGSIFGLSAADAADRRADRRRDRRRRARDRPAAAVRQRRPGRRRRARRAGPRARAAAPRAARRHHRRGDPGDRRAAAARAARRARRRRAAAHRQPLPRARAVRRARRARTWAGLAISYLIPKLPPSSAIIAVAAGIYLLAFLATSDLRHAQDRAERCTMIRGTEN